MINRVNKCNKAKEIILEPLLSVVLNKKILFNQYGIIRVLIQLDNRFTILVNDKNSFRVPDITNDELENMLNLLYQFSEFVDYKPTLSGKAFFVDVKIPLTAITNICKIIPISKYQKVA